MIPPPLIAIFGAAVLSDGRPSRALLRRIAFGHAAGRLHPEAPILCSGGVGRVGPSEASVMGEVLGGWGVAPSRLILDEDSLDTLQSAVVAARLARRHGCPHVVVCSDGYHVPRIRLLLAALGAAAAPGPRPPETGRPALGHQTRMSLREALAIPYDLAIVLARRRALAAHAPPAS